MNIIKLEKRHREIIFPLFENIKSITEVHNGNNAKMQHDTFSYTYLSELNSYHSFGAFSGEGKPLGLIACYQNSDEASWYGTHLISKGFNKEIVRKLLDHMIKFNEEGGRYKFYTLWNAKHLKLLRRYAFSEWANDRYDYFDEIIVPYKTKCFYTMYWQVLFNRTLLPQNSIIRCTFLKQKYRQILPIGGGI